MKRIMCWLGFHKWVLSFYGMRNGIAFGDKCSECGIWSKQSIRRGWEGEVV